MNLTLLIEDIVDVHAQILADKPDHGDRLILLRDWTVGACIERFHRLQATNAPTPDNSAKEPPPKEEDRWPSAEVLDDLAYGLRGCGLDGYYKNRLINSWKLHRIYPYLDSAAFYWLSSEHFKKILRDTRQRANDLPPLPAGDMKALPTPLPLKHLLQCERSALMVLVQLPDPWMRAYYENGILIHRRWTSGHELSPLLHTEDTFFWQRYYGSVLFRMETDERIEGERLRWLAQQRTTPDTGKPTRT